MIQDHVVRLIWLKFQFLPKGGKKLLQRLAIRILGQCSCGQAKWYSFQFGCACVNINSTISVDCVT